MRNVFLFLVMVVGCMFLVACGSGEDTEQHSQQAQDISETENQETAVDDYENEPEESKDEPSITEEQAESEESETDDVNDDAGTDVEQVMLKAQEAMSQVTSMSMDIQSERNVNDNGTQYNNFTALTGEVVLNEPLSFHQKLVADVDGTSATELEMYRVKDKMYMNTPMSAKWAEIPITEGQENLFMANPTEQFSGLESLNESFTLTEEGNEYVITFTGDDSQFQALIDEAIQINNDSVTGRYFDEAYDSFEFSGTYEYRINKDTYYFTSIQLDYESVLEAELSKTDVDEKIKIIYDNFNEYDEIVVPEQVINNSQPLGGDMANVEF